MFVRKKWQVSLRQQRVSFYLYLISFCFESVSLLASCTSMAVSFLWFWYFPYSCSTELRAASSQNLNLFNVSFTGVNMSGTNKSMELHLQMRHNTEDLVSFMRDLENWETDIKKKDEELRTGRVQEAQVWFWCHYPSSEMQLMFVLNFGCSHIVCFRRSCLLCATRTTNPRWGQRKRRVDQQLMVKLKEMRTKKIPG